MMRELHLDFVAPPRWQRGSLLLLVAGAAALLAAVSWRTALEDRAPSLSESAVRASAPPDLELRSANEMIDQLALPWGRLFRAVEGAAMPQVMLLAIAPDTGAGTVQISAAATDAAAMFDYAGRLAQQQGLAGIYLRQHQVDPRGGERPLRFVIMASWMPSRAKP